MKLREAINALKLMRDVRVADDLLYMWINELEGRVQLEVMLFDALDVTQYKEEDYDANLMILPPNDHLYVDWLLYKSALYHGELDAAQKLLAEFGRKFDKYAAWYMNMYRPAERRRKEKKQWETTMEWTPSAGTTSHG